MVSFWVEGDVMNRAEKYQACVDALKEFCESTGFTDAVLGLSGGIDSALVAAMAVEAMGADHVHAVLLPGPYSSEHSIDDAEELARRLGIGTRTISICEPFEAFEKVLASACGGQLDGLAAENTQARIRMTCIMAISNTYGYMMLNTGNKSEACMGYSTLYGDTAGAFAPIGGLYKTDVFALCRWLNQRSLERGEEELIPIHIITKPPSAELSPDQSDENSLGVTYDELDRILMAYVERGEGVEEIVAAGHDRILVERIVSTTDFYEFKRAIEPPYPDARFYQS